LALEIEVDISPRLRERLLAHQIDLAFLLGPLSAPSLRNKALGTFELAFLASPRLGLPARAPLAKLAEHPIVTFARGTKPHIALEELFAQRGVGPSRLHASAALSPAIKLALDGIAVAAAELDHHPDLEQRFGRVRVAVSTHRPPGISVLDLALVDRVDAVLGAGEGA